MYKVHYQQSSMPGVAHTCNPNIRGWKQENQEFKVFPGYIAKLRLAWVMWDPAYYPHLKEYIQEVSSHRYGKLGLHCYLWRARCTNLCTCRVPSHFYNVCTGCWKGATAARRALLLNHEDQSVDPSTTTHVGQQFHHQGTECLLQDSGGTCTHMCIHSQRHAHIQIHKSF